MNEKEIKVFCEKFSIAFDTVINFAKEIRKETAKEILKEILLVESVDGWQENKQLVDFINKIVDKIERLAKQFGVEVEE